MAEIYSKEFRQEMLRRMAAGESPKALAEETGAKKRTLEHWRTIENKQGNANQQTETGGVVMESSELKKAFTALREMYELVKEENGRLKEENEQFKEENEFLLKQYLTLRKLRG